VVDDLVPRAVELPCQHHLGDRHANGVREALAERTRRGLDPGGDPNLGMPRRLGVELANFLRSSIERA